MKSTSVIGAISQQIGKASCRDISAFSVINTGIPKNTKKLFKCKVCGKKLTTKGIMKRHLHDRHSGGRPFDCLICSKSFKQKNHLKRHMNSSRCLRDKNNMDQNGKRLFSCEVCGKKSKKRSNLERHMRVRNTYAGATVLKKEMKSCALPSQKKQRKKLFHNINVIFATFQWTGRLTLKHTCLYGTASEDV